MRANHLDPQRPGIQYVRAKGHYTVRMTDKNGQRIFCGCRPSLHEAQRLWDEKKAEMSGKQG